MKRALILISAFQLFSVCAFAQTGHEPVTIDTRTHAVQNSVIDASSVTLTLGGITAKDTSGAVTWTLGSTNGTKLGATGDKIGFLGATPVTKPTGSILTALPLLGLVGTPTVNFNELSGAATLAQLPTLDAAHIPSLDASKITTGVFAKAQQHAATAYTDAGNTFTGTNNFDASTGRGVTLTSLANPATPILSTSGTAGTTSRSYAIVAKLSDGTTATAASTPATITTTNATLNSSNYDVISWTAVTGATYYDVYRTVSAGTPSTTGRIATNLTATTYNDQGAAGDSTTPPGANNTGGIAAAGNISTPGVINSSQGPANGLGFSDRSTSLGWSLYSTGDTAYIWNSQNFNVMSVSKAGTISALGGKFTGYGTSDYMTVFNVKEPPYNAAGNGTTDDTAAIQSAINDAAAVHGTVYLPPVGTYLVSTLNINGMIRFSGSDTSTGGSTLKTNSNAVVLNVTSKCTIDHIAITGSSNPAYTAQDLILITNTNDVYLRNLFLTGGYNLVHYDGVCFYCYLDKIRFYDSINSALRTTGSNPEGQQLQLHGCIVTGGAVRTNYVFQLDNVGSITCEQLIINHSNTASGGVVLNTIATNYGGFRITGSDIELENSTGNGPALKIVGTNVAVPRNVQVSNSYFGAGNLTGTNAIEISYLYQSGFTNCIFTAPARGVKIFKNIIGVNFTACDFQTSEYPFISDGEQGTAALDRVTFTECRYVGAFGLLYLHPATLGNITVRDSSIGWTAPIIDRPAYNSGKTVRFQNCFGGDGTGNFPPFRQGPLTAPAMIGNLGSLQNPFDVPVTVYIAGSIDRTYINATDTGGAFTRIDLEPGQLIGLAYSSTAPTWTWWGR